MTRQLTFLAISCDYKGVDFLKALHGLGHRVFLVTSQKTEKEDWPRDCLDDIFFMPGTDGRTWDIDTLIQGTAYLFRRRFIDKIIALDDYDVRKAAILREEFRSPGMGQTTARHFFDKLAMRMIAREKGIRIPGFSALFHDQYIRRFLDDSEGPWIVKPRSDAGALGIRKLESREAFWEWNAQHEHNRHQYLVEEFKPGHVYHVDTLFIDYKPLFSRSSRYLQPPFEVAHGGGVFRSHTLEPGGEEDAELSKMNAYLLRAFGLRFGASHSEFIRSHEDGMFYFLETSARVGGAHLADMVHAASGINLWQEWARIESAMLLGEEYELPEPREDNAGIVVTLSRFQRPDYDRLQDPAIWWRLHKDYHIGIILRDPSRERVLEMLDRYTELIFREYHTSVPLRE